ncbi:MAG: S9 family peptidase [Deltaproteobacteria bacterium]|nr:MAG: S9 family peptidase [Deltaproteobacteria bacterium]
MRTHEFLVAALCIALAGCGGRAQPPAAPAAPPAAPATAGTPRTIDIPAETIVGAPKYPPAPREDVVDDWHGVPVPDPYRWLEDPNDPRTRSWVDANDALARKTLAALPVRAELVSRLRELLYIDYQSAPVKRGGRYFYTRRHKDREKAIVYVQDRAGAAERALLDPNQWSEDGSVSLGGWYPSYDGTKVAYKRKQNNADESVMYVRDVATGKDSEVDVIEGAKYASASWTPKGDGFYYTYLPTDPNIPVAERPGYQEVRFHRLGTDPSTDEVVFPHTGNPQMWIGADVSRDGRWLVLYASHGWNANDVYIKDLRKRVRRRPTEPATDDLPPRERIRREAIRRGFLPIVYGQDAKYGVDVWKNKLYIRTDEGAPRYRLFVGDARRPQRAKWKEIVPQADATLSSAQIVGGHLVLHYLRNAYSDVEIRRLDGRLVRKLALPGIGTAGVRGEPDDDEAYYSFTSFNRPVQIFKTSIRRGNPTLWSQVDVPVDTSAMEVEQVWFESKDGTKVPMFLVYKKGIARDGSHPTLLYGYGGFNVSLTPHFSSTAVVWVEHGGIYAVANLRGGGEFGEQWHRAGMLANKQNVFDDFIAAAEHLIREGYTSPDKLAIMGGSNGGLLVGAAMTQRPELFRAVVCAVPLLDMVRYHLFGSGRTWIPEYGSAEDPDQFKVLYAYSPYHHIQQGVAYPALLMMSADADDRVDPMHARKFVAAIQWAATGDRPYLLRVERHAGHGGADLVKANLEKAADQLAFLMWQLGMTADAAAAAPSNASAARRTPVAAPGRAPRWTPQ